MLSNPEVGQHVLYIYEDKHYHGEITEIDNRFNLIYIQWDEVGGESYPIDSYVIRHTDVISNPLSKDNPNVKFKEVYREKIF